MSALSERANIALEPEGIHAIAPPEPSEFDFYYFGWRVVFAACLGVMAGFGSLFVYTFSVFVKPLSAQFG